MLPSNERWRQATVGRRLFDGRPTVCRLLAELGSRKRHRGNALFCRAVTAQNDEFKGSVDSSYSRSFNVKTWPRNSILSLDTFVKIRLSQHKFCTRKMELALEVKFYLDFH